MTTKPLKQENALKPANHEIRGAALVAHVEAQLALAESGNQPIKELSISR